MDVLIMNNVQFDIVKKLIERKMFDVITEYSQIIHNDKGQLFVCEYAGTGVRVGKDVKGNTRVFCPKDITPIQEGHVAQAITNGSIFDDADEINNNAEMIQNTTVPCNAMINDGKCPPKHLKSMITLVIGKMNDDGTFDIDDAERINGVNFIKDLTKVHGSDQKMTDVFDNYLEKDSKECYGIELGKEIIEICKEIDDICNTKPEDCITDDDCCDSYDGIDMDEIEIGSDDYDTDDEYCDDNNDDDCDSEEECEEECCEESYEYNNCDDIYQEGAIKTLKRLGYDPKTKTILIDIPDKNSKNGEKVRCSIKFGDSISLTNGPCITGTGTDEPVIHVPLTSIIGNTKKIVEILKHEEGHLYVSLDRDRFKKDFEKSIKFVDKNSNKLSDHGNVPEEYVADLYAAKTSGYGGEGLIKFLKGTGIRNRKQTEKLKKIFNSSIKSLKRVGHRLYMDKTPITDKEKTLLDDIFNEAMKCSYDEACKSLNDHIPKILDNLRNCVTQMSGAKGAYAAQFESSQFFEKPRKKLNEIKKQLDYFKNVFSGLKKMVVTSIPKKDFDKCIKILTNIDASLDNFVKVTDYEIKARIAFIRKYVNETGDIDTSEEYNVDQYDDESDVVEETVDSPDTQTQNNQNTKTCCSSKLSQESFLSKRPKKLKPIPRDIIAYITCEMNDIHSSNDQAMLSGYTCSKIELVDFYLTVLDTQDVRYIVPHNRQYLSMMKQELERLLAQILKIRPINRSEQIWRVNYPSM